MTAQAIVALVLAGLAWWSLGAWGFIFWWTHDFDLEGADLFSAFFVGLCLGPFTWLIGMGIHSDSPPRVIIPRRTK